MKKPPPAPAPEHIRRLRAHRLGRAIGRYGRTLSDYDRLEALIRRAELPSEAAFERALRQGPSRLPAGVPAKHMAAAILAALRRAD